MDKAPAFSVIVPVYKVEEYLRPCVDSILGQSFSDFELLLVDDGSPDGSGAICDEYGQKDGRVRVIHQKNSGVTAARRAALEQARADYVCFVDGDDWVKENWLQTVRGALDANGRPDMLVCEYARDDSPPTQPLRAPGGFYDRARMEQEIYPYMLWDRRGSFLTQQIPGFLWAKCFRRELVTAHFIQDGSITVYEDVAMVYECLYHARSLVICPETLYVYRQREGSALSVMSAGELDNVKTCRDYMLAHLVRQAPEMRVQTEAFFADKILRVLRYSPRYGMGIGQTARYLGAELDSTGLARDMDTAGLPAYIRLFLALLRRRIYYPATLLYRMYPWLYWHVIARRPR